jgi:hypothetical protein
LENYDAVGRYRAKEKDKDVDSTGFYQTRAGKLVKMNGARELATFLADSPEAHAAFVEQMFHHLVQQPIRAYGKDALDELSRAFRDNKFHVRRLAIDVVLLSQRSTSSEQQKTKKR